MVDGRWAIGGRCVGVVLLSLLLASCATTADDVHAWGDRGQFERIRNELGTNPEADVRIACAHELSRGSYVWAIGDLAKLSLDPSPEVRLAAVEALGAFAGREVYSAILQRCADDNRNVSAAAERILKTWGSESIEVLLESVLDRSFRVRSSAVQVLGRMPDDARTGPTLIEVSRRDDNGMVRREAVKALGVIGYRPARSALYQIKNTDASSEVCLEAEAALTRIGGTVFDWRVVVFPVCDGGSAAPEVCSAVVDALTQSLVQAHLCELAVPPGGVKDRSLESAVKMAKDLPADQVVHVSLEREGNRVSVTVRRVEVGTGKLVQQETVPGFEGDVEQLCRDVGRTFVSRFQ